MKRTASLLALLMALGLGAVACEQQGGGQPGQPGQSPGAQPGGAPGGSPGAPGQGGAQQ